MLAIGILAGAMDVFKTKAEVSPRIIEHVCCHILPVAVGPAYVQYSWASGSHVRLSGILRELSYRDNVQASNHFATGWGPCRE